MLIYSLVCAVSEELLQMRSDFEADVSIGTENPDQEPIDDIQIQEVSPSYLCTQEDVSTSKANEHAYDNHGKP